MPAAAQVIRSLIGRNLEGGQWPPSSGAAALGLEHRLAGLRGELPLLSRSCDGNALGFRKPLTRLRPCAEKTPTIATATRYKQRPHHAAATAMRWMEPSSVRHCEPKSRGVMLCTAKRWSVLPLYSLGRVVVYGQGMSVGRCCLFRGSLASCWAPPTPPAPPTTTNLFYKAAYLDLTIMRACHVVPLAALITRSTPLFSVASLSSESASALMPRSASA